jgi:penicillin-binding protein 1C
MVFVSRRRRLSHRARLGGFKLKLPAMNRQKLTFYIIASVLGLFIVGYVFIFAIFAWYARDLPQPGKLSENRGNSTIFYDRNDKVIYEMFKDANRVPVDPKDIPERLKQATVAIEDKRFYEHKGISEFGIIRAAVNTALGNPQGGSTITQQLIKNVLLTSERRLSRKIKEAILAYEVEKRYSKDEILGMYLNEVPYGGTYVGIGSASKAYFDKEPQQLNLLESAFLAGLPQSPSRYSPFIGQKNAWKGRTKDVLRRMSEDGYITSKVRDQAIKDIEKLKFTSPKSAITAPHFIFYVREQIEKEFGADLLERGVKIKTTLDSELQKEAERIIKEEIEKLDDFDVGNGASLSIDSQTGEIITYVGSYDYNNQSYGKFDVISQGYRQPGSTLKPIEYATALEKGYTASSVIMDVKTEFPGATEEEPYVPVNYDGKYRGPVQIRFALGNSLNVPAVKMLAMIGLRDFMQKSYDMGIKSLEPTSENIKKLGLSASLGGGETTLLDLTKAYTVLANGKDRRDPVAILKIEEFSGKKIYEHKSQKGTSVLPPEVGFIISHILSDNNARVEAFGTNSYLRIPGKTVAVKSGTTDDKRDNWAVGYTKSITLGVWVGNNDNSKMNSRIASGSTGASPIWHYTMRSLLKKYDDGIIEIPENVEAVEIDAYLGGKAADGFSKRTEYFVKGSDPKEISPFYKKLKISKSNGKLANDIEVRSGNFEEKDFIVITEKDPVSGDGRNRWQEAIDAWVGEQNDDRFKYPTEKSDSNSEEVVVSIRSPNNESKVETSDKKVEIRARITSLSDIKEVTVTINGEEKKKIQGNVSEINETFELENGKYEIKVRAINNKDKSAESSIKIGVNQNWQAPN